MNRPARRTRRKRLPRSYAKIRDQSRWNYGMPIGIILLIALGLFIVRMALWWGESAMDRGVGINEDLPTMTVPPGEFFGDQLVFASDQTYVLTVHPRAYPCKAAVVRVGKADETIPEEELAAKLMLNARTVGAGETRRIENTAKPGRYAWAVWHEQPEPVEIFALFLDSRGR